MTPEILTFPLKEKNYNYRNNISLQDRTIKIAMYGSETISSMTPNVWDILPTF